MVLSRLAEYDDIIRGPFFSLASGPPTLSQSLRTPFRKTIDGADCSYFSGQKDTPIILLQLTAISCFSAITLEFANELETTALNSKGQKTVCSVVFATA